MIIAYPMRGDWGRAVPTTLLKQDSNRLYKTISSSIDMASCIPFVLGLPNFMYYNHDDVS